MRLFALPALLLSFSLPHVGVCATVSDNASFYEMPEKEISKTISDIHKEYPSVSDRIAQVSAHFLGTPYRLGPLGEGPSGEFNRQPLISFKAVDCTTSVEETMALSLAKNLDQAKQILKRIRYKGGKVSYQTRNHFPSADWIPNNIAAGFVTDITAQIAGPKLKIASKIISKKRWYAEKKETDIQGYKKISSKKKEELLRELRNLGAHIPDQKVFVPYLPIGDLPEALSRIPSGTIANLVRADRPTMPVLISHQIFIINKGGIAYVRHAAFNQSVQDVPALDYFDRYAHSDWKLLGLNLLQVADPTLPSKSQSR